MLEDKKTEKPVVIDDCWNRIGVWGKMTDRCPKLAEVIHCRNCPTYSLTGRRLLDRPVPDDYRQEWTSVLARATAEKEANIHSAFVFRTGGEWLALPAKLIQEIVDMNIIHSLPHRSNAILRGVVNIRGKLELCFSIGALLNIERFKKDREKKNYTSPERLVVAGREGERIVFPVTEVRGTFRYAEGTLQKLPVTVSGSRAAFTKGILSLPNIDDVGLLDDQALFKTLMRNLS
ncbi:MAG: chemotaxis protein CheW [Deltaproteobacteria bacterium]|nr:chemotaxis protein CheW [Deltaproteobacteria bacterium]